MKIPTWLTRYSALCLGSISGLLVCGTRVNAAQRVVLTYGPFAQSVEVADLKHFAETGEETKTIGQIVGASGQNKDTLRGLMTLEIGFSRVALARILYSSTGEQLLKEMGESIRTQRRVENAKALRAAMMLAVSDDEKLSFLEILEKYPVPGMYVDIGNVGATVEKIKGLATNLQKLFQESSSSSMTETTRTERTERRTEQRLTRPTPVQPASPPVTRPMMQPMTPIQPTAPVRGLW